MTSSDFEIQLEGVLFKVDESCIFLQEEKPKKTPTNSEDAQYLKKSVSYLFTDKKLLLSFYHCKCPSVNYLCLDLGQRFPSYIYSGRKHFVFLGYSTLAIKYASEMRDRTHYLALLTVHSNFFRHRQANASKPLENRGILSVLIQQGIMKFKKANCKVLHLDGAIPSTNKICMGNGLGAALRRT